MTLSIETAATLREIGLRLRAVRRVLFITGAGISADSGLPTYRGVGGLYNNEATEDGLEIEEALSGACFAARPEITWKYLAQIEHNCRNAAPNAAHRAIAALEASHDVVVLTQNIDGLHGQAGSRNLIEIHGTLAERFCPCCGAITDASDPEMPPHCRQCGQIVRPGVVLFGEMLPERALDRLYRELDAGFDMTFVIGTTAVFPYIAEPVLRSVRRGAPTVEINPARTYLSGQVSWRVAAGAAEAMTAILQACQARA